MKCCKNKCKKCERYSEKCMEYKKKYLNQETRNDELVEMLESLIETQKKICEYIENEKVSGVNIKNKTSKEISKDK
tara:strand:+ start:3209 stop:3436 length:228 start_codon:yes stop_codon:yes gene_type:complete